MINLPNVTLWGAVFMNTDLLTRTIRVLKHCERQARFGRTVLFCAFPVPENIRQGIDVVKIPQMDAVGWNIFLNRISPLLLKDTEFSM